MDQVSVFIALQVILLPFMALHDWVHLPPLTDICELEKHSTPKGRLINSIVFFFLIFIPLCLTIAFDPDFPLWVLITNFVFYFAMTMGTLFSWWVPYLFTSSQQHKKDSQEYKNTHHFLPARGDNVIPNTFHVILNVQIWICFLFSFKFLFLG
jgi:hypothetical protein